MYRPLKQTNTINANNSDPFYPKFMWKEALLVVVLIAAQKLGQPASLVIALLLVILCFRSAKGAVQAITLATLLGYLNPYYFPGGFSAAAKWIVIFAASCAGIIHSYRSSKGGTKQDTRWLAPLLMFIAVAGLSSLVAGADPGMALFKLFTFSAGALGAMYVFSASRLDLPDITNWFYTVWVVIVVVSLPLVKFGQGYLTTTGMFMGILSHSQSFATFSVPICLYLVLRWLVGMRLSGFQKCIALVGVYLVYLSSSRTGVFAFVLALVAVAAIYYARGHTGIAVRNRLVPRLAAVLFAAIVLNVLTSGSLANVAGAFSRKYGEKTDVLATRGGKIDRAKQTFQKYAMFGKGFGLPMDGEEFLVKKDPTFGLPLSAPVEAGVIYTAAPAQLGIIGTAFLLILIYVYLRPLVSRGSAPFVGLAFVCFLMNFGEYVFFSTGGVGMYHWLLYALAYHVSVRYPEALPVPQRAVEKEAELCRHTT